MPFTQLKQTQVAFNACISVQLVQVPKSACRQQRLQRSFTLSFVPTSLCTHRRCNFGSYLQLTLGNPGSLLSTAHICQAGLVMPLSNISAEGWPFAQSSHKYIIKAPLIRKLLFWWCINIIHHQDVIWGWWIIGICHRFRDASLFSRPWQVQKEHK